MSHHEIIRTIHKFIKTASLFSFFFSSLPSSRFDLLNIGLLIFSSPLSVCWCSSLYGAACFFRPSLHLICGLPFVCFAFIRSSALYFHFNLAAFSITTANFVCLYLYIFLSLTVILLLFCPCFVVFLLVFPSELW